MLNTNEKFIKHKLGLLNLVEELGNVSRACKVIGLSRGTFYRYKSAMEDNLFDQSRRKPNMKNRTGEATRVLSGVVPQEDLLGSGIASSRPQQLAGVLKY